MKNTIKILFTLCLVGKVSDMSGWGWNPLNAVKKAVSTAQNTASKAVSTVVDNAPSVSTVSSGAGTLLSAAGKARMGAGMGASMAIR